MEVCIAYSHDGRLWHSYNNNEPAFSRGSDSYLCVHHVANSTYDLFGRAELSTDIGWREIRGVNMARGELHFAEDIRRRVEGTRSPTPAMTTWRDWPGSHAREDKEEWGSRAPQKAWKYPLVLQRSFHLDGQGALERYRRQIYRWVRGWSVPQCTVLRLQRLIIMLLYSSTFAVYESLLVAFI
jgi:hypothetical protein